MERITYECDLCGAPDLQQSLFHRLWFTYKEDTDPKTLELCDLCFKHIKVAVDECKSCQHPGSRRGVGGSDHE